MNRSLGLSVNPHKDGGVSLTVVHSEVEGDETSTEKHSARVTEKLPTAPSVKAAASVAIDEYFERVKADGKKAVDESPIGRAAKA